jgi:predicted aminopeptidase
MVAAAVRRTADTLDAEPRAQVLALLDDALLLLDADTKPARHAAERLLRSVRLSAPVEHLRLLVDVSNACLLPAAVAGSSVVSLARRIIHEHVLADPAVALVAQLTPDADTPHRIRELLEACAAITEQA